MPTLVDPPKVATTLRRLFGQIARLLVINRLRTIAKEVVETARERQVIRPLI